MNPVELAQPILRGAHLLALLSTFGTLLFLVLIMPVGLREGGRSGTLARGRIVRLAQWSSALALVTGFAWLLVQAAVIAGADSVADAFQALPIVAMHTQFGHLVLVRLAVLIPVLPLIATRELGLAAAIALTGIALGLQSGIGHAGAIGGRTGATLIGSELMQVVAAGAWLGGLLPLLIILSSLPQQAAVTAFRSFSAVGLPAVLVLAGTALVQASVLIGSLPGLLGTPYGHVALLKLVLFLLLLAFAALNRFALTTRLAGATAPLTARRHMRLSVSLEMAIGALVVTAAAVLASLTPGVHQQPVWPLRWRPSLEALAEPELRSEVVTALIGVAAAVIILLIGLVWRRWCWPLLIAGVVTLVLAIPHLDLLVIPAYPTSFFTSPTEFAASSIAHGAKLYQVNCVVCHGADGHGDGPAAQTLVLPPADLTAGHLWAHSDGELFWFVSHGIERPNGTLTMPGFAGKLSSEARWHLIDYLRAHNAGESMRSSNSWPLPLPVPQFNAECADGRIIDMDLRHGRTLRIILGSDEETALPAPPGVALSTIVVPRNRALKPQGAACVSQDSDTWAAFAILTGASLETANGTQVIVDKNGWLRARWLPNDVTDPASVYADIRRIDMHPLELGASNGRAHHH